MAKQYTFKDETHSLGEWAEIVGIEYGTLYARINVLNWSVGQALGLDYREKYVPANTGIPIDYRGKVATLTQHSIDAGLPSYVVRTRVKKWGWTLEEALTTPPGQKRQRAET